MILPRFTERLLKILLVVLMTISLFFVMVSLPDAACNECHSKNPKMRKMHELWSTRIVSSATAWAR